MATRRRPNAPGRRTNGDSAPPWPQSWIEATLQLVRAFGVRRLAGALLIAVVGAAIGWSGDTIPETSEPTPAGGDEARTASAIATGRTPTGTAALRRALARLPGTGTAGVYRLLRRHGLLGEVSEEKAAVFVEQLRRALEEAEPAQRLGAARVLIALGASAGAPDLVALSKDEEEEVRLTALAGLGRIRGEGAGIARERLQDVCGDAARTRPERFHAIQSLSRLDQPVDVDLVADVAAREPDPVLRLMAARTLLAHRDRRAVPVLLELLQTHGGGQSSPEDVAFVQREANDTLRAVTPKEPDEETPGGWRDVAPRIEGAMASSEFTYTPRTLRLQQ